MKDVKVMHLRGLRRRYLAAANVCALALLLADAASAVAETCIAPGDLDAATKSALGTVAQRDFDLIAKGDVISLRASTIPSLASDFSGIEATVKEKQPALAASKATARPPFVLQAEGTAPLTRAEFLCGVFGSNGQTQDSAIFTLENLPPGKYAVVILDAAAAKGPYTVSLVLQQIGAEWKLGGLYIKAAQPGGHDSDWFAARAKEFQTKGQAHNAEFYYVESRSLASPLPFMSTAATDKLYDDSQKAKPADLPADEKPLDLTAGTATYKVTTLFPEVVGDDLNLIVRYKTADVSNTNLAYQNNVAVMKALLTKYPELRGAFAGLVARGVDPSGHDYGTMLGMKDIK
jgi:hypothetical protein